MNGITNTSPEQLAAFLNRPVLQGGAPQAAPTADPDFITKVAHVAAQITEQRQRAARQEHAAMTKRSGALRASVRRSITKISQYQTLVTMQNAGYQLDPEVLKALPGLRKQAMAEMDAIEDKVVEHDQMAGELMDDLIDAAAEDPVTAAEMISEATGTDVDPEEVEAAAGQVAEVMVKDELSEGNTKESSAQKAQIKQWADRTDPFSQRIVLARATTKASHVLNQLYLQHRGQ
jgi:hypothetical protein